MTIGYFLLIFKHKGTNTGLYLCFTQNLVSKINNSIHD